ncbi:MAG: hypothetical protein AAGB25_05600, partial [Pseudomonadota bacterium]
GGDPGAPSDAESLRFLANLNDIFLSVGILLLTLGVSVAAAFVLAPLGRSPQMSAMIVCLVVGGGAWAMAEYFTGRRKLLLPSMTLALIIYACAVSIAAIFAFTQVGEDVADELASSIAGDDASEPEAFGLFGAILSANLWTLIAGVAAMAAFYARFRLPFSMFLIAVSGAFIFYTLIAKLGGGEAYAGVFILVAGLATLAAGVWFDGKDPERHTLDSDNAFWLHMAAAPQIMIGARMLVGGEPFEFTTGQAVIMLVVLILIGFASLALNRRALIVSGLLTFAAAIITLFRSAGVDGAGMVAGPLLVIGGSVVLLGGGWRTARRAVLKLIPETPLAQRIFPPEPL